MDASSPRRVVVVGGGFGGLACARRLAQHDDAHLLDVTLVDAQNHHTFQPLLYQVATAGLQPQDVGHPLRPIFGLKRTRRLPGHVTVRLGEVVDVDREAREVVLADGGRLPYDDLVLAAGARTADFGIAGVAEHGYGLKSLPDALELRDHLLRCFETAATQDDPDEGLLTFVVVGGGPTGVELSGAIAELVDHVLRFDHPTLDVRRVRIVLVEMLDRLLSSFHPRSSRAAYAALRERGVEVRLGTSVTSAHADHVVLDGEERLPTRSLVWVAGVRAAPIGEQLGVPTTRGGRVEVTGTLHLVGDPRVHVIGDLAASHDRDGDLLPQLAPVAQQQGRWVADRILADVRGERDDATFRYLDKGTMATIGRGDAVAELPGRIRFGGFPAWVAWLGLHLLLLVGFRNRAAVLLSWLWNYVTYDRASRLILGRDRRGPDDTPLSRG